MKQSRNFHTQQLVRLVLMAVMTVVALAGIALAVIVRLPERKKPSEADVYYEEAGEAWTSQEAAPVTAPGTVRYQGKTYVLNDHLSNYLLLGVDTEGSIREKKTPGSAGQTDAIFLLSYDRAKETVVCLAIPRDTITQIEIFTPDGESTGFFSDHINLQYAFGDGRQKSCELSAAAVSRLLSGIRIDGCAAVNLSSIPKLATLVDGVEITIPDDTLAKENPAFTKGSRVLLDETNTELFVRYRDTDVMQSGFDRMNRQKVFIEAFAARLSQKQKEDASTVTRIFETMKEEMITNMSNDIFVDLAGAERVGEIETIPGSRGHEGSYDVYRADESALYDLVIRLFYKEEEPDG